MQWLSGEMISNSQGTKVRLEIIFLTYKINKLVYYDRELSKYVSKVILEI